MPQYGITNAVKATEQSLQAIFGLTNGDTAAQIVPPDTKFVIAIEAIARNAGESFYETDSETFPLSMQWIRTPEGINGRFIGYISCSDTKLRIQQVLDVQAALAGQQAGFAAATKQAQLLFEDDFSNLSLTMEQGSFVLASATQKFKLLQPYQLTKTNGRFESSATGFQNGFSPFFKYLKAHGMNTNVVGESNKVVMIVMLLAAILFAAIFVFVTKKK